MRIHQDKYGFQMAENSEQLEFIMKKHAVNLHVRIDCPKCFKSILVPFTEAKRVYKENNCNFCNHE